MSYIERMIATLMHEAQTREEKSKENLAKTTASIRHLEQELNANEGKLSER